MSLPRILSLPREVVERIADGVDLSARVLLCQVSKAFHWCTIPSLYREIQLTCPSHVVACCRTLIRRRIAAISVRRFTIQYTPSASPAAHYFASFYSIIRRALMCMSHLQELNLLVPDPQYAEPLRYPFFHSLSHFECYLALTDSLIMFLNRHPTIVYLQIAPGVDFVTPTESIPQIALPKLQYFIGAGGYVSAVVPKASLRAAFLIWETTNGTPLETIKSLEESSGATINLVSCRRSGWNLDLIDLISIWLPDIYVLIITNILDSSTRPSDTYMTAVANKLSRFTMLRHFHLHCVHTSSDYTPTDPDADFATVTEWGTACQSLVECILPYSDGMKWVRFRKFDTWIPDPSNPHGSDWTWNMLLTNKHPTWTRLNGAIAHQLGHSIQNPEDVGITLTSLMAEI